jgi:branched-chain amino acid transport system ATP-binding protein
MLNDGPRLFAGVEGMWGSDSVSGASATSSAPLLAISDLSVRFGGIAALSDVSFEIGRGQICGLIGPNGAGKTTLFNCLSRLYEPDTGRITFDGHELLKEPRHRMAALGIGRTFQNLALFESMSVRRNIMVGGHSTIRGGFVANALRLPLVAREEEKLAARVDSLIEVLDLVAVADAPVKGLTFAVRKRVELARALACEPKLLLLDEPAGGLNAEEVERLIALILMLRERFALTVLLVEHHMNLVMRVSDKVVALNFGKKIGDGTPEEVRTTPEVERAYLGEDA